MVGFVLALWPSLGAADESSRAAMEHFRRGTRAYDLGHFTEAAAEYEKAYEAKENPALLYNLGQAYRGAGEHQKALNAYRAYLRNATDAPNREEVVRFIEALKHTIEVEKATKEKPPVGTLPATPPPVVTPPVVVAAGAAAAAAAAPEPDQHELALGRKLRIAGLAVGAFGVAAVVDRRRLRRADRPRQPAAQQPDGPMRRLRQVARVEGAHLPGARDRLLRRRRRRGRGRRRRRSSSAPEGQAQHLRAGTGRRADPGRRLLRR